MFEDDKKIVTFKLKVLRKNIWSIVFNNILYHGSGMFGEHKKAKKKKYLIRN